MRDKQLAQGYRPRNDVIDWARGLVMVVMALDHTRDFVGDLSIDATDVSRAGPLLFLTRWITHLCAPTFVLLTGISIWLTSTRGRSRGDMTRYLLSRGIWLILLEFTWVHLCWELYRPNFSELRIQVIAAIGFGLITLSVLIWLPRIVVGLVGLVIVLGHNALDFVTPGHFGEFGAIWRFLHDTGPVVVFETVTFNCPYAILPWIGVMCCGYAMGPIVTQERVKRRITFALLGIAALGMFVFLRGSNLYGNPDAWTFQATPLQTTLEILNCNKYPPSLNFLTMSLGPMFLLMAIVDRVNGPPLWFLIQFGRVPLFFYLIHLTVIQSVAFSIYLIGHVLGYYGTLPEMFQAGGLQLTLPGVYLSWIVAIVILYWPCRWFAKVKQQNRAIWLTYL